MLAFVTTPLPSLRQRRNGAANRRRICRAAVDTTEDETRPRFSRADEAASQTKRSFLPENTTPERVPTPNERVLSQIRESMERLGVSEAPAQPSSPNPIDISRVNPLSAFAGALGAAGISYAAWFTLTYTVQFFSSHPLTTEIYVVQRISAVVRTALVCLFALGSGISGVTALGLFLLGGRTSVAALTGEFRDKQNE